MRIVDGVDRDGLRQRRLGRRHEGARPTRARSRSSRSSSASARGCRRSGRCSACPSAIDIRTPSGDVHRNQDMWTYWYLQEGEIAVDPKMFDRRDGSAAARHPRRHRRAAPRRRRPADHRRAVGHLLQARPPRRAGRRRTADGRPRVRRRPVPDRERRSGVPGHVVRRAVALHGAVQGLPPLYKDARSGGAGAFTADNFPVFDYMRPNVYVIADSQPRLQDDRRRPRGREGRLRRPLLAARIRSASSASRPATCTGLEQPVSLELSQSARFRAPSRAGVRPQYRRFWGLTPDSFAPRKATDRTPT